MKKLFIISLLLGSVLLVAQAPAVHAAKPTAPSGQPKNDVILVGNDVSYPQCGGRLPVGQAFGIVGVNGGLANTNNPCFLEQLAWAQKSTGITSQPAVSLYVNTANPGHAAKVWPQDNVVNGQEVVSKYGVCDGSEGAACAYIYGWTRAHEDATIRNVPNPSSYQWWLDVETGNSWSSTDLQANAASLEGMTDYFKLIGATVGLYSTAYQWQTIVGNVTESSSLYTLDSWLAGALTKRGAEANCKDAPLTSGGTVTLTQFVSRGLDYDVSCR